MHLRAAEPDPHPLVGRAAEIAAIRSLLEGVQATGGALILRGEPGIGKSRLLQEAAAQARDQDMTVLTATGVQSEARLPFSGLHQLLRPVRDRAEGLPEALRASLDAAFGRAEDDAPEQFGVAIAVLDLISDVAAEAPVAILVDDAHWLDRASSEVLAFVARRLESDPVVFVAATRDGYDGHGLVDTRLPHLRLDPLEPTLSAELLDASVQHVSPVVRDRVLREAAGNPLALIELPLASTTLREGSPPAGQLPLTERLERAFAARISDLPDDTQLLVLIAALIDGEDISEVLRAGTAITQASIDITAFEPAAEAAILELDLTTVRFRHPLMRSAVRQHATVAERRRVHQALADMLAGEPDRSVWHRAALIGGPHEQVAVGLERAGRRAQRRGAPGEAFLALRRAAELSEPEHRLRRLLAAAQIAQQIGEADAVPPLLREAQLLQSGPLERARASWVEEMADPRPLANEARAQALITAAEDAGEAGDRDLQIDLLWLVSFRGWWGDLGSGARDALIEASARLFEADSSDPRVISIYAHADPLHRTQSVLPRLSTIAADRVYEAADARHYGAAALVIGAFDLASTFLSTAVEILRAEAQLGYLGRILVIQGLVDAIRADLSTASPAADESRRLATEFREPLTVARADAVISIIAGTRGDVDGARRAATRAERVATPAGARETAALAQIGPTTAALGSGQYAEAYRLAERVFTASDPAHHPVICAWLIADLAEAAVHSDQLKAGRARLAQVEAALGSDPGIWLAIGLRHARAVLAGDDHAAAARFAEALRAELSRWPFQRARLLFAYGQWLRRRRRIAESRDPLRAARDEFDALGCLAWAGRAREELRASGEFSRRRDAAARDELTPQELQIAQLAAQGRTNREIGERLYLSPRTISTHLYRVFPKLGITARDQLRAALQPAASSGEGPNDPSQ